MTADAVWAEDALGPPCTECGWRKARHAPWCRASTRVHVEDDDDLVGETDARAWAERFAHRASVGSVDPTDAGTMLAWFAVAIEAGRSAGLAWAPQ